MGDLERNLDETNSPARRATFAQERFKVPVHQPRPAAAKAATARPRR